MCNNEKRQSAANPTDDDPMWNAISNTVDKLVEQLKADQSKWSPEGHSGSFQPVSDEQILTGCGRLPRAVVRFSMKGSYEVEPILARPSHELVLTVEQWKDSLHMSFMENGIGSDNHPGSGGAGTLEIDLKDVVSVFGRNVVMWFNAPDVRLEIAGGNQ